MKKYFIIVLISLFISSCTSVPKNEYVEKMKDNKMIYEKIENKMIPTEPINIFNNNKLIATINLGDDGMTLFIDFHNGEIHKLWKYYDYSGVDRIYQSNDETIIHLFYWEALIAALFPKKEYVTEFNLITKDKKTYRLKNITSQ